MADVRQIVVLRGRVQGVFFRATTRDIAGRHAVTGWVRNEPDGSVRCMVEGTSAEITRFLQAIKAAKRGNIDSVDVEQRAATGEFDTFEIRR